MARTDRDDARSRRALVLETIEVVQRSSARTLFANGRTSAARRAESFASWARFAREEPEWAARLRRLASDLEQCETPKSVFQRALAGALSLLGTGQGKARLFDTTTGTLRTVAQRGFDPEPGVGEDEKGPDVQSTDIVGYDGELLGVISARFAYPRSPSAQDVALMYRYGQLVTEAVRRTAVRAAV